METVNCDLETDQNHIALKEDKTFIEVSSNCEVNNGKEYVDTISTVLASQADSIIKLEDVVSLDTCILLRLKSGGETCKLDLRLTNGQKIARIAIVSEASVLEFFKQSGEYANTIFADFIDEFDGNATYMGEMTFQPPTPEASINFTRMKIQDSAMWLYGIKLILTEAAPKEKTSMFNLDVIDNYLQTANGLKSSKLDMAKKLLQSFDLNEKYGTSTDLGSCHQQLKSMNLGSEWSKNSKEQKIDNQPQCADVSPNCNNSLNMDQIIGLRAYIDNSLFNLEKRLIKRIEIMEDKTQQKLDIILKQLQMNQSS